MTPISFAMTDDERRAIALALRDHARKRRDCRVHMSLGFDAGRDGLGGIRIDDEDALGHAR